MSEPNELLVESIKSNDIDAARSALRDGANVNWRIPTKDFPCNQTPLMIASELGRTDIVKMLLDLGASVKLVDKHVMRSEGGGATALHYAIKGGNSDTVRLLLQAKADPNKMSHNGDLPLDIAAFNGRLELVKALVEGGADVNKFDGLGVPIAGRAVESRNLVLVEYLLDKGVDANSQHIGGFADTLLHTACYDDAADICELLLTRGADPNRLSNYRETPLGIAVKAGALKCTVLLLANQVNVNQIDRMGKTVLDWLEGFKKNKVNLVIRELIVKAGGKRATEIC